MSNKDLCLQLLSATDEKEVEKIIKGDRVLSDDNNWKPYGGFHGNFNTIHNQQGDPIPALVEKPINSIDALLLKQCKIKGIDPQSAAAPKTICEAVETFYKVKRGDFTELTEGQRREIAESLQIIATGSKSNPCITIYDAGEGQHPSDFENTLLSLNKDNKLKIKFVQGKYNMGGTGAIPNCGTKRFQLIVSRKHPSLLSGKGDLYGFSLVRLHKVEGTEEYKNSWYEYCVGEDGQILTFESKDIEAGLYNRKYESGTIIKLFNYDLPRPSDITLDLWRDLNRYMYSPALPVLLYERRDYKGKSPTKLMLGNRLRVMIDDRDKREKVFPMSINTSGVKVTGEVIVFKDGVDKSEFIDKMAIIFTINGQVHSSLNNQFITSHVKLPYLSGSLLINLDCTDIPTGIREDIFMPSRDRMRDSTTTSTLKEEIARELRDNDYLRQLNEKRREDRVFQNPQDENFMKKIMGKLLAQNDEIARILGLKGDIKDKIKKMLKPESEKGHQTFRGKRFPSFVRFKNIAPGNIKMIPQNGECKLSLETDVEDEYLLRNSEPGELKISFRKIPSRVGPGPAPNPVEDDEEIFDVNVVGPNQGEVKIRIKAKKEVEVGAEVPLDITMTSPSGDIVLQAILKVINPHEQTKKDEIKTKDEFSLPKIIEVYKEKKEEFPERMSWAHPDFNWTGDDICKVYPSGEKDHLVDAVAINMDADVLHDFIRQRKITSEKNIEHLTRLFKVSVFLISLILNLQISQKEDIEEKEEIVAHLMKGVGKIILQVAINDELLKEVEKE